MSDYDKLTAELEQTRLDMLSARGRKFDQLLSRYNEIVDELVGRKEPTT